MYFHFILTSNARPLVKRVFRIPRLYGSEWNSTTVETPGGDVAQRMGATFGNVCIIAAAIAMVGQMESLCVHGIRLPMNSNFAERARRAVAGTRNVEAFSERTAIACHPDSRKSDKF